MRTGYFISGIMLAILGLFLLVESGGLTFWFIGNVENETTAGSATVGVSPAIGWLILLAGLIIAIVGAVAGGREESSKKRVKDITVVKT